MTYLSSLGYLLGVEGVALLRGFTEGSADRRFVAARLAEIRSLLDTPALAQDDGVVVRPGGISPNELYRAWASHYDYDANQMIEVEEPIVHDIVDTLPVGTALDAACGTGRHTAYLHQLGHQVIGIDRSPEMLAQARKRLPDTALSGPTCTSCPSPTTQSTPSCAPWR